MGVARETFKEYIQDRNPISDSKQYLKILIPSLTRSGNVPGVAMLGAGHLNKVRPPAKKSSQGSESGSNVPEGSVSYISQRPAKRQRSRTMTDPSGTSSSTTIPVRQPRERRSRRPSMNEMLQIQVDDQARLEQWFKDAFLAMQQVACRLVAKVWIKKIHPKKVGNVPLRAKDIRVD